MRLVARSRRFLTTAVGASIAVMLASGAWVEAQPSDVTGDAGSAATTTVIVTLKPDADEPVDAVVRRADLTTGPDGIASAESSESVHRVLANLGVFVATVDSSQLEALRRDPAVGSIEQEELAAPALANSVPHIGADELHALGVLGGPRFVGDDAIAIAIMDTGVDASHPAFDGRVLPGACFARGADGQPGPGDCPNGLSAQLGGLAGAPCDYGPGCEHGTHVAGIAGSSDDRHRGVAPEATILPLQVFSNFGGTPLSWKSDQLAALDWLIGEIESGAKVAALNMSLGGGRYPTAAQCDAANPARDQAFRRLAELNVAVVASAGNNGWSDAMSAPACVSSALSVGATAIDDSVACYSNRNADLDFWAPGGAACTGGPGGIVAPQPGGTFVALSGTSMSAPHVAGAIGLLRGCMVEPETPTIVDALRMTGVEVELDGVRAPRIEAASAARSLVPNDDLVHAQPVAIDQSESVELAGTTACARTDDDGGASVWYRIDPSGAGLLVASTASGPAIPTTFDTQITLYKGASPVDDFDDLTRLGFDDDGGPATSSRIVAPVNGGDHYYLQIRGEAAARGVFGLRLTLAQTRCAGRVVTHVADTEDLLMLGSAAHVVLGTDVANRVSLGGGDDLICAGGGDDLIFGGDGADVIYAGPGDDVVWAGKGDDLLFGGDDADELIGDGDNDVINGNAGADVIRGGAGDDTVRGGPGDDQLFGNDGADRIDGNGGNDSIEGQGGDDRLVGHAGDDRLFGGSGTDVLYGGHDADTLYGHDGADTLHGGAGPDVLWGGDGDDTLHAASGDDVLRGNSGADVLRAGGGADQMWGGLGADDCDGGPDNDPDTARMCETVRRTP